MSNQRDWHIYHALAMRLTVHARALYAQDPSVLDLDASAYALDSTTIDLYLSLLDTATALLVHCVTGADPGIIFGLPYDQVRPDALDDDFSMHNAAHSSASANETQFFPSHPAQSKWSTNLLSRSTSVPFGTEMLFSSALTCLWSVRPSRSGPEFVLANSFSSGHSA